MYDLIIVVVVVVVALEVKCKNIITGVFYFSTIVQVFNQLPTDSSRINVFRIPITSLGVKLMCSFNWLSILWRIYNQLWWKDHPVEWFTFAFNFKIEKLTKKCLFLQWEETQGKKTKKTKTQTRLHQTQLVEQSLGHKKKRNTNLFSYLLAKGWHLHGFHSCSPRVLRHTPTTHNPPICPP